MGAGNDFRSWQNHLLDMQLFYWVLLFTDKTPTSHGQVGAFMFTSIRMCGYTHTYTCTHKWGIQSHWATLIGRQKDYTSNKALPVALSCSLPHTYTNTCTHTLAVRNIKPHNPLTNKQLNVALPVTAHTETAICSQSLSSLLLTHKHTHTHTHPWSDACTLTQDDRQT